MVLQKTNEVFGIIVINCTLKNEKKNIKIIELPFIRRS